MSKVGTLLKVVNSMIDNPSATNSQIASMAKVSEPYIKKCKDDIQKLCPHLWKLLLHKNDVSFIISKLNANNGYEKSIIERLSRIYPEQWDGTMRLATSDDTLSNEMLSIGLCSPKGDDRITNHWLMFLLYDFLFRIDDDDGIDYRLARSIEPVDGYAVWRLKLRDSLFWSDGKPIDNEDVLHTVYNSPIAPIVQEIREDDEKGVIFTLFSDDILFPRRLSGLPILPSHSTVYEVTNGPFRLRKGKSPVNLHLYRNREYYRDGHPKLDRINLKTFARPYFAIKAVEDRKIDIFFPLSLHEIRQYSNASIQRFFCGDLCHWMIFINGESRYMKRKNMFRNLRKSIDYEAISRYLSGDIPQKTRHLSRSPGTNGIRVGYLCDMPNLEIEKAIRYIVGCFGMPVSEIIEINDCSFNAIKDRVDVILTRPYFGYGYSAIGYFFHSEGKHNIFGFDYPSIDALIERLDSSVSMDERDVLGHQIINELVGHEAIILLAPHTESLFSNLYLEPSPKISTISDFIISLSNIIVERGEQLRRKL